MIAVGVDWARSDDLLDAWTPVLDRIDALQLTVEQGFAKELPAAWTEPLDRCPFIVGHAVLGAPWTTKRTLLEDVWLQKTKQVLERWPVRWLIDHVGCCRAAGWESAPVPLPASRALVRAVADNLRWMAEGLEVPVGLENLALAASADDAKQQADVVGEALEAVDGLLLLDVHNLWCQAVNYDLDPIALLERWPLERAVQLHVAGGSWKVHTAGRLRRDTHDDAVPDEVFTLLPAVIARCPRLEVVVLERIAGSGTPELRAELERLHEVVRTAVPPVEVRARHVAQWRDEAPDLQEVIYDAIRRGDHAAVEATAPGWWTDARSWEAAVELSSRWGRALPELPAR